MKVFDRQKLFRQLTDGAASLGLELSESKLNKLIEYLALLTKWNAVYNLTAVRDPSHMVVQHLLDSLAVVHAFTGSHNVLDVGSGGGLPGIVLAIVQSDTQISMIDIVHKKTAFLTQVKAELGLTNVIVHTGRVEHLQVTKKFDIITSRAFAELADFINVSSHLLDKHGKFIAMKGIFPKEEIARLPPGWQISEVSPIKVPEMDAERHLVIIQAKA